MANYNLTQTGEEVQRILNSVQTIDNSVTQNSSHPVQGGAVYDYSAPRLIIPLNNYVDVYYKSDIVSRIISMIDDIDALNTWRALIGRGASPQIVIDLEDSYSLYINSVVADNTWFTGKSNYLTLSFYLVDRYVNLTFAAPSDDPGGGS